MEKASQSDEITRVARMSALVTGITYLQENITDPEDKRQGYSDLVMPFLEGPAKQIWPKIDEFEVDGIVFKTHDHKAHKDHQRLRFSDMKKALEEKGIKAFKL